jgi:DNA topoisomerase IB
MRLRRSDPSKPGIRRIGRGRGFSYEFEGRAVTDAATLDRVRALVLPPAWKDVWICPDDRGHIQATGVDAAGRRQYRYHDEWRIKRDAAKFEHVQEFARGLRRLRRVVARDLAGRGLTRSRVLAAGARVLDTAALRVGGEAYARDDDALGEATFGLATLRRDHVLVRGEVLTFCFPGKGAAQVEGEVRDAALARVVRALLRRNDPSEELLAHWTGRQWCDVRSADLNAYLREASGLEISAKDFRTWHATVGAAIALAMTPTPRSRTAQRRAVAAAMRQTAQLLGNTPAVARSAYVDSRIVDRFAQGETIPAPRDAEDVTAAFADRPAWERAERAVLDLLTG